MSRYRFSTLRQTRHVRSEVPHRPKPGVGLRGCSWSGLNHVFCLGLSPCRLPVLHLLPLSIATKTFYSL